MQEARVAPINALIETLIKSFFLSGAIALIPDTKIPTEDKLAKPHNAYKVLNLDLSVRTPGSMFASAP